MINSLYQLTAKGFLKALSFLLACALFAIILLNSTAFATQFGGRIPFGALLVFYGMAILWIHGIGFEIKSTIWKVVFLPLTGYFIAVIALIYLFF